MTPLSFLTAVVQLNSVFYNVPTVTACDRSAPNHRILPLYTGTHKPSVCVSDHEVCVFRHVGRDRDLNWYVWKKIVPLPLHPPASRAVRLNKICIQSTQLQLVGREEIYLSPPLHPKFKFLFCSSQQRETVFSTDYIVCNRADCPLSPGLVTICQTDHYVAERSLPSQRAGARGLQLLLPASASASCLSSAAFFFAACPHPLGFIWFGRWRVRSGGDVPGSCSTHHQFKRGSDQTNRLSLVRTTQGQ